jgi:hypothetical protein
MIQSNITYFVVHIKTYKIAEGHLLLSQQISTIRFAFKIQSKLGLVFYLLVAVLNYNLILLRITYSRLDEIYLTVLKHIGYFFVWCTMTKREFHGSKANETNF